MKKTMTMLLITLLSVSMLASIAHVHAEAKSDSRDLLGKYKGETPIDAYSVDIVWGGMKYDYNAARQEWNSTTHRWEKKSDASWSVADGSSNKITVTNHSSKAVNVKHSAAFSIESISGSFSKDAFTLPKPAEGEDGATSETVTFMPSGELDKSVSEYTKVGTITVSISADETENPGVNKYTVKFVDYDGTVLKDETVEEGMAATPPADPTREGYRFIKWDKAFDNVQTDLIIKAVYEEISDPTIYIAEVKANAGDTVDVAVFIRNNPGIAGATITISYDSKLTLTNAVVGDALADLSYTKPGKYVSPCNFTWDSESGMALDDGVILTLTFNVADDAEVGDVLDIYCSYRKGDIYDESMTDVNFEVLSGSVTIK